MFKNAKSILFLFFLAFCSIFLKVTYLSTYQQEYYLHLAKGPRETALLIESDRATIRDRENRPLVVNQIAYDICISFDQIAKMPRVVKEGGERIFFRKAYVERLAHFLGSSLDKDPDEIEDLLHKSALFPKTSFCLKEDVDERIFYRLKFAEKDWPGLEAKIRGKRSYPEGALAFQLLGGVGAISAKEYGSLLEERKRLQEYIDLRSKGYSPPLTPGIQSLADAKQRLAEWDRLGYHLNCRVGKWGLEQSFDSLLRGKVGKERYEVDVQGRSIRRLPDSIQPSSGKRVLLSLSSELQQRAEKLLIEQEDALKRPKVSTSLPWIKGGAIIALDPKTFEILALANYPRMDPRLGNKSWSEYEASIGDYFDGICPLQREKIVDGKIAYESEWVTYPFFIKQVLSLNGTTQQAVDKLQTLGDCFQIQKILYHWMELSKEENIFSFLTQLYDEEMNMEITLEDKAVLDFFFRPIVHAEDRVLFLRLIRLFAPIELFSDTLQKVLFDHSLVKYRELCQEVLRREWALKKELYDLFSMSEAKEWRKFYFSSFLTSKRKQGGKKPYLDYYLEVRQSLFRQFFNQHRALLLCAALTGENPFSKTDWLYPYGQVAARLSEESPPFLHGFSKEEIVSLMKSVRGFNSLNEEERSIARAFLPKGGFNRHMAYREVAPLGSIFKVVSAYAALKKKFDHTGQVVPHLLTIQDDGPARLRQGNILGRFLDESPIPRRYRGGRLPRSDHKIEGWCDLQTAFEQSSNIYFSLLAAEAKEEMIDTMKKLKLGKKTGIELPAETAGRVPTDLRYNLSGLYSLAIGQHSLDVTPLQASLLFSAFVNGGYLKRPTLFKAVAGFEENASLEASRYSPYLSRIGFSKPIFSEGAKKEQKPFLLKPKQEGEQVLIQELLPPILKGLHRVVNGEKGAARPSTIRYFQQHPDKRRRYEKLRPHLVGKTGTAQVLYRSCLDKEGKAELVNHIWFATAYFPTNDPLSSSPELVVVVYLRFGEYGKEAVPAAVEMVDAFLELKQKPTLSSR